jgi:hypothetical protein
MSDEFDDHEFDEEEMPGLDEHEAALVAQDLEDLAAFEEAFAPDGYRGMAVYCQDCAEDHYYPWEMLRENLRLLLETGDIPVHEPAFAPEPDRYVPWDYARGYVDALHDLGADRRVRADTCHRCGYGLPEPLQAGNFCPRCGTPLLLTRLLDALRAAGLDESAVDRLLGSLGLPMPLSEGPFDEGGGRGERGA